MKTFEYFEAIYNQSHYWNIVSKIAVKKILTTGATSWIIRDVTNEEIKTIVFHFNHDKAPGPDEFEFSARFYHTY